MQALNLPPFNCSLSEKDSKTYIFDIIRKKYIVLNPEEWVRQHFVNFMISHRNYSKSLIKIETGLNYGKRAKRTDIQVFDNSGTLNILVECKAPEISINEKVFNQIFQYNKVLNPKILIITNGIEHVFIKILEGGNFEYLSDLPFQNN